MSDEPNDQQRDLVRCDSHEITISRLGAQLVSRGLKDLQNARAYVKSSRSIADDILLIDVTLLTLSIEGTDWRSIPIIERNTAIPVKKTLIISTTSDWQTSIEIHVLQGEGPKVIHNETLGRFIVKDVPPKPRGVPQIEVSFDIDANGFINVSATDRATGREQKVTITASSSLSKNQAELLEKEARSKGWVK